MKAFSKSISNVKQNMVKSRQDLEVSQQDLMHNKMDSQKIELVKKIIEDDIKWN